MQHFLKNIHRDYNMKQGRKRELINMVGTREQKMVRQI